MLWSYLTNSKKPNESLTFEQFTLNDIKLLAKGYCELVVSNFFESFSREYDEIFISHYGPGSNPLDNEKLFSIKFTDKNYATQYILENAKY